jgi:hypothetical protein
MTREELLRPRIKVITDYPDCPYAVGSVIEIEKDQEGDQYLAVSGYIVYYPEKYPHLFEPLPWWKDRKVEDMPEYVKITSIPMLVERYVAVGQVVKAHKHFSTSWGDYNQSGCQLFGDDFMSYSKCEPATTEEYEAYLQTTNQLKDGQ